MLKKGAKLNTRRRGPTQYSADLRMLEQESIADRTQNSNFQHRQSARIPDTRMNDDNEEKKE